MSGLSQSATATDHFSGPHKNRSKHDRRNFFLHPGLDIYKLFGCPTAMNRQILRQLCITFLLPSNGFSQAIQGLGNLFLFLLFGNRIIRIINFYA